MTFGSLFTGIGGLDLGLERAGMQCLWQVEIDSYCRQVLEQHWPGVKRYGDIRQLTGDELEPVDLICGGFPCQDLSQAGKRAGIEGTRSSLWFEFARLVGKLGPRYVLIENVPGLLIHDAMRRVIGNLARLGYVGCWRCLRASDFGAAHLRKRVFIVAYCKHARRMFRGETYNRNGNHASGDDVDGCNQHVAHTGYTGTTQRRTQPAGLDRPGPSDHDCGTGGTLANLRGTRLPDPEQTELPGSQREDRRTAPEFCGAFAPGPSDPRWPDILRDQPDLAPALESPIRGMVDGLPDWLDRAMQHRTKRLGRLGNAVVPQIAEWIGLRIIEFDQTR